MVSQKVSDSNENYLGEKQNSRSDRKDFFDLVGELSLKSCMFILYEYWCHGLYTLEYRKPEGTKCVHKRLSSIKIEKMRSFSLS